MRPEDEEQVKRTSRWIELIEECLQLERLWGWKPSPPRRHTGEVKRPSLT